MKFFLLLFSSLLIAQFGHSQKRSKKHPVKQFEYTISNQSGKQYPLNIFYQINAEPLGIDSVRITGSADTSSLPGKIYISLRDAKTEISTENGNFQYTVSTYDFSHYEITIDFEFDNYLENATTIDHSKNLPDEFFLNFEQLTILNDPDSGGIIIHSAKELSQAEIDTIVWCYLRKKNGVKCYDESIIHVSIIL